MQTIHLRHGGVVRAPSPVTFVDRDLAASLLLNFLIACDADEPQRDAFMAYARLRAESQLEAWGVAR